MAPRHCYLESEVRLYIHDCLKRSQNYKLAVVKKVNNSQGEVKKYLGYCSEEDWSFQGPILF